MTKIKTNHHGYYGSRGYSYGMSGSNENKTVFGVLMMSALASVEELVENATAAEEEPGK